MVAYRFVTEELVTEPHPTVEFETDWQMPPLWAAMEFIQGADSTEDGSTNGVFLGADTGTVEIEIFIGHPVNLDGNALNTGPHTLAYYYDLVPGITGRRASSASTKTAFRRLWRTSSTAMACGDSGMA